MGKYDDIINMQHKTSTRHIRMSKSDRASQFAPFSALTGFEDAIEKTSYYCEDVSVNDEDKNLKLNK